jgi:hypothetical protein
MEGINPGTEASPSNSAMEVIPKKHRHTSNPLQNEATSMEERASIVNPIHRAPAHKTGPRPKMGQLHGPSKSWRSIKWTQSRRGGAEDRTVVLAEANIFQQFRCLRLGRFSNRVLIMLLAIVLLWMTSLTVSRRIVERIIPVPENGLMYERCDNAWEYTKETSASYGQCVDAQIDFCQKKFVLMFSILKEQTAAAMLENQQKLGYIESWDGGCTHAHLAIVKKRLANWVAKSGENTLALERIVDNMPASVTIRGTGEIKSCVDVSRALKTIADSGCHGDACVNSVHDAALAENARFTADAVNNSGRLSNYISQRTAYDQQYVASATNYSANLDGFAVDIPLKMPDVDLSLNVPDLVGNTSISLTNAQIALELERERLADEYNRLQKDAQDYETLLRAKVDDADQKLTAVREWRDKLTGDVDIDGLPDLGFGGVDGLPTPDFDASLPTSKIPTIMSDMSDGMAKDLSEDLGDLNDDLARKLNNTAKSIAGAVPQPPPYEPPQLGGKPANESHSDFVDKSSAHLQRTADYLGQLANATLDFVESSLDKIYNISATHCFFNLTVSDSAASGGSALGLVTVSKGELETGFKEAFASFAGIDTIDPAAPTVEVKSVQSKSSFGRDEACVEFEIVKVRGESGRDGMEPYVNRLAEALPCRSSKSSDVIAKVKCPSPACQNVPTCRVQFTGVLRAALSKVTVGSAPSAKITIPPGATKFVATTCFQDSGPRTPHTKAGLTASFKVAFGKVAGLTASSSASGFVDVNSFDMTLRRGDWAAAESHYYVDGLCVDYTVETPTTTSAGLVASGLVRNATKKLAENTPANAVMDCTSSAACGKLLTTELEKQLGLVKEYGPTMSSATIATTLIAPSSNTIFGITIANLTRINPLFGPFSSKGTDIANLIIGLPGQIMIFFVSMDLIFRFWRTLYTIFRFWNASVIGLSAADMRIETKSKRFNIYDVPYHIITSPAVGGAIVFFFLFVITAAIQQVYLPLFEDYADGCVRSHNGTMWSENLYAVLYNYATQEPTKEMVTKINAFDEIKVGQCTATSGSVSNQYLADDSSFQDFTKTDNAANVLGLMGADLLHSIAGAGYNPGTEQLDTSAWPSADVMMHSCVDLGYLQANANFTDLNALLYTAGEDQEDALGLSYLGCSVNANTRYREDASVWCSVGLAESGRCTAGLSDFSFSCDDFKCNSDKVLNCRGPSSEQLGYYSRKCACTVEWWVHSGILYFILAWAIYLMGNFSRIVFIKAMVRMSWRQINDGVFEFLANCTEEGQAFRPGHMGKPLGWKHIISPPPQVRFRFARARTVCGTVHLASSPTVSSNSMLSAPISLTVHLAYSRIPFLCVGSDCSRGFRIAP